MAAINRAIVRLANRETRADKRLSWSIILSCVVLGASIVGRLV